jgi:hypothetical protein
MKRSSPLTRKAPLKATKPIRRVTRIKARNEARAARLWTLHYHSEAYVGHVHSFDCIVPGCERRDIEACHARSKGAGGTWRNLFGCCSHHHRAQHQMGDRTFRTWFRVNPDDAADRVYERWLMIGGSPTPPEA